MNNLSEEQAWSGAQRLCANARSLLKAANRSASAGEAGVATALCILSLEESTKAYVLLGNAAGFEKFLHPLAKYFHSHKSKHEAGLIIYFSVRALLYFIGLMKRARSGLRNGNFYERVNELMMVDLIKVTLSEGNYVNRMLAWSESADKTKQRGLYVDFVNGDWQGPDLIGQAEFQENRRMARDLVFALERAVTESDLVTLKEALAELPNHVNG